MKGVFVRLERDEIKETVEEMLETNASLVELNSSTSALKKLRNSKSKLQKDFLIKTEEIDIEIEKIKAMLPEVQVPKERFSFKPGTAKSKAKKAGKITSRKTKHETELEAIRQRLEQLRQK